MLFDCCKSFYDMNSRDIIDYFVTSDQFCFFLILYRFEDDELWAVKIKGSAFLWHQIRCMVAVLFLIGQGLESPNVRNHFSPMLVSSPTQLFLVAEEFWSQFHMKDPLLVYNLNPWILILINPSFLPWFEIYEDL